MSVEDDLLRDGGGTEILDPTIYHQRGEKEENLNQGKTKGEQFQEQHQSHNAQ